MDAFLGAFEGTTKARFCPNGTELLSARLGTRINIIGGCDEALITQFSKWAISDQLEKTKLNPVKALMPGTLRREEEAEHGLIPPQKRARTNPFLSDDGLLVSDSLSETPVTETPVTETFDSMNVGMPIVKDIDDMDDFGAFLTDPLAAPIVKEVASGMDVMGGSEALGTAANPVALTEQASCASTKGDMTEEKSVSVDEDDGLELVQRIAEEAHHQFQMENGLNARSMPSASSRSQKTMIEKMALHGYGSMLTQAGSGQSGLRNGATVIAPASTRIAPATHVESEEGHEVLECERDRKAELRKQRNREAAQRSNAKRKLKNDTLKSELQACHTKAAELRAKELSLREENIKLRKLLSS